MGEVEWSPTQARVFGQLLVCARPVGELHGQRKAAREDSGADIGESR